VKGIFAELNMHIAFFVHGHLKEWYRQLTQKQDKTRRYMR